MFVPIAERKIIQRDCFGISLTKGIKHHCLKNSSKSSSGVDLERFISDEEK